jgi:SPP1 family predicted phage head-tail adaptor
VRPVLHDPGWLRQRVAVQSAAGTPDEAGGETIVWDSLTTLWARIEPTGARETIVAGHLSGVVTHDVTLRWRDDIAGGMRIALSMTGADLVRVLTEAALPRVDAAVRERAERTAREASGDGVVTRVWRRGAGEYVVEVNSRGDREN